MTIENTGNTYRIFSDYIDEFVDDFPTPSFTLELVSDAGCEDSSIIQINPIDISSELRTEGFPVPTTVFFYEIELPVGVHALTLRKTVDSVVYSEFACIANVDELECDVVNAFRKGNQEVWILFEALRAVENCDACICTELCPIFSRLMDILNGQTSC